TAQPRLGWVLEPRRGAPRGEKQSAYEIMASSSRRLLARNQGDLWQSGRVESDQTAQVTYQGKPLTSEQECFWKVRSWDQTGKPSPWSEVAHWSVGLLSPSDWQAEWIGMDEKEPASSLAGTCWIWFPEGRAQESAPLGTRYFRRAFTMPEGSPVKKATWLVTGDNQFTAYLNGEKVGEGANFKAASDFDVTRQVRSGKNLLAASVANTGDGPNPAGFVGVLRIEFERGDPLVIITDEKWRASAEHFQGWSNQGYDDSTWLEASNLGPVGMQPWGEISGPEERRLPARWLRKDFQAKKEIRRAMVYMAGLGLSELYLDGKRVGDEALSPAL
ncbi:MAG: alpha-L-rhamnosidase N-terminal domain-containing protein, partial [Limisphaerales bacterium]